MRKGELLLKTMRSLKEVPEQQQPFREPRTISPPTAPGGRWLEEVP
jgi:hypothetical protein